MNNKLWHVEDDNSLTNLWNRQSLPYQLACIQSYFNDICTLYTAQFYDQGGLQQFGPFLFHPNIPIKYYNIKRSSKMIFIHGQYLCEKWSTTPIIKNIFPIFPMVQLAFFTTGVVTRWLSCLFKMRVYAEIILRLPKQGNLSYFDIHLI